MPSARREPFRACFAGMPGPDVFCERCGARQPVERREGAASGAGFARRLRSAVTGTTADGVHASTDSIYLRLCLDCRGYYCPNCWNDPVGVCQTCEPLPEPEVIPLQTLAPEAPAAKPLISFAPEPEAFPDFEMSYYFRPATVAPRKRPSLKLNLSQTRSLRSSRSSRLSRSPSRSQSSLKPRLK